MIVRIMLWGCVLLCFINTIFSFTSKGRPKTAHVGTNNVLLLMAMVLALSALSGCTTLRPDGFGTELSHNSGLLTDGRASDGTLREDSLDVWNNYVYWQRGTWYAEAGMGLKVREGGFYLDGPPIVFNGRVGRRFRFAER